MRRSYTSNHLLLLVTTDTERPSHAMDFSQVDFAVLPQDPLSPGCQIISCACEEEYRCLASWVHVHGLQYKAEYDTKRSLGVLSPLSRPSGPHELSTGTFRYAHSDFNRAASGRNNFPLRDTGSCDVRLLNGSILIPDSSVTLTGRNCPNIVFESGLTNLTFVEFIRKIQRYIIETDNIMYAIGWKRLEVAEGTPLVAVAFSRLNGATLPLFVINFGNAPLSYQALTSLRAEFGVGINVLCRGLGFQHDPECGQAMMALYTIVVPLQCVVCADTTGQQLFQLPNNGQYAREFMIDLFDVRQDFIA